MTEATLPGRADEVIEVRQPQLVRSSRWKSGPNKA